jgi:hypothetical protein
MADDGDIDAQVIANLRELQRRQAVRPDPPPLRIHHLMACAAVAAIEFSLWRTAFPQALNELPSWHAALMTLYLVLTSIGLTCAIISIYWHVKGYAGLVQPGQWLLVSYAISALNTLMQAVFAMSFVDDDWQRALFEFDTSGLVRILAAILGVLIRYVLPVAFFVWCAWKVADILAWRLVFITMAITHVIINGLFFLFAWNLFGWRFETVLGTFYLSTAGVTLLFEAWAVRSDLAQRRKRYWTHWVGLGLSIGSQIAMLAAGIFIWLS